MTGTENRLIQKSKKVWPPLQAGKRAAEQHCWVCPCTLMVSRWRIHVLIHSNKFMSIGTWGGPGSIPRLGVICGLSLLVLYPSPRGFLRVLRFPLSLSLYIVNAWRWVWNWTSSFVSCFCPYFWPLPCTKHTKDNQSNPLIKLCATNLPARAKRKQKIVQGHGQFNIDCNNIVLAFESSKVS